ncbi:MAG: DUF2309 domain-containing protein [Candidatus Xenobia bacterium]
MSTHAEVESRRMEIQGIAKIASDAVAKVWPLRTFVHHNPLVDLESVPFDQAVRLGCQRLGGRGYLSCDMYRSYLSSGRIQPAQLDTAIAAIAGDSHVELGTTRVSHGDVLRAALVHGVCCPGGDTSTVDQDALDGLSRFLSGVLDAPPVADRIREEALADQAALGRTLTLSQWCDRALGTRTVQQMNDELIKWCAAFLDEGHATWPMPGREQGFYQAWRALAPWEWSPCGITDARRKIAALPDHPEGCLQVSLSSMRIPFPLWADYLSAQIAALPGWTGFIRWRADQKDHPWQKAFPINLVQYLAVRQWYESELVSQACRAWLAAAGTFEAVSAYMQDHAHEYVAGKARSSGQPWPDEADHTAWRTAARRLLRLARALDIMPTTLQQAEPQVLQKLSEWLDDFPESQHGRVWLETFEATYRDELVAGLAHQVALRQSAPPEDPVRPQSQSIYCIDVRMEPIRRHLEALGNHETFGFAGFFAAPIRFRSWGAEHDTEQCPAVTKPRNEVREIPRSYRDHVVARHQSLAGILHAGRALVDALKENVVTPFVMVESLGWFYGIPLIGKTLWPGLFARLTSWVRKLLVPHVATSLTVDKLPHAEIDEMLVAEQRAIVWKTVRERVNRRSSQITPGLAEALRQQAVRGDASPSAELLAQGQALGLTPEVLAGIVDELRERRGLDERSVAHQKRLLSHAGFTIEEQVMIVEALLRMIGLLSNFARLIVICGHGSSSSNNPYEAALDCGACGGNTGKPNARLFAMMANNPEVRQRLRLAGIAIPSDTCFVPAQFDTTTDRVELFDLEDVPATHRRDVIRLKEDLQEAGMLTSQERYGRLPDRPGSVPLEQAWARVEARSTDWSQVRPEWGLSGNAAFIIGPRHLTRGLNLGGRVFMNSYDWRLDPSGVWLEAILTGPQLVCEWIALEHYFSTVDNDVYGSGSKVYHNVVGRLGVMSGPSSDLRVGLPQQTVMNGTSPFHEPMRLLSVIEAPRERLDGLMTRHELLEHYYRNEWVHLVVIEDGQFYRFSPTHGWIPIKGKERVE